MSLNMIREIKFESTRCPARSGSDLVSLCLRSSWRWW